MVALSHAVQHRGAPRSRSGTIVRPDFQPPFTPTHDAAADEAALIFELAFPGASERAQRIAAAKALGCGEQTARRILRKETGAASWPLVRAALNHALAQIPEPFEVPAIRRFVIAAMQGGQQ